MVVVATRLCDDGGVWFLSSIGYRRVSAQTRVH